MNNKNVKKTTTGLVAGVLTLSTVCSVAFSSCNSKKKDHDIFTTSHSDFIDEAETTQEFEIESGKEMYDNPAGENVEIIDDFKELTIGELEAAKLYFNTDFAKIPKEHQNTNVLTNAAIAAMTHHDAQGESFLNRNNVLMLAPADSKQLFKSVLDAIDANQIDSAARQLIDIHNMDISLGARALAIHVGMIPTSLFDYTLDFIKLTKIRDSADTVLRGAANDAWKVKIK